MIVSSSNRLVVCTPDQVHQFPPVVELVELPWPRLMRSMTSLSTDSFRFQLPPVVELVELSCCRATTSATLLLTPVNISPRYSGRGIYLCTYDRLDRYCDDGACQEAQQDSGDLHGRSC